MRIIPVNKTLRALSHQRGLLLKVVAAFLLLLLFVGNGKSALAFQSTPDESTILAAYNASIYDSSVYKFSNLRPLKPLKFDPTTKSASVVALTDFNYKLGETTLPVYVWVTAVPEVQEICRGFSGDLELRLRQLFGLHPNRKFSNFVVMTVKEGNVFRPTANPDPTTTLPCSYPIPANCGEAFPDAISEPHIRWFANQMLSSYVISESTLIPVGYPWTRLGYTYDWKPGANKYGASEYVIRRESTVTVTEIVPYKKYCSQDDTALHAQILKYKTWTVVNSEPAKLDPFVAADCASVRNPPETPHKDKYVRVYVNDVGQEAMLMAKNPKFPVGTIVIKEKLPEKQSQTPEFFTIMVKREAGYDPRGGDWQYLIMGAAKARVEKPLDIERCQSCHSAWAARSDFVSRVYLSPQQNQKLR